MLTIGYGGKMPDRFFEELESLKADVVVDVRENPFRAFMNVYTKRELEKCLGDRYIWIRELGNKSRELPPMLVDEEEGLRKLRALMEKHRRIVLLCAEKDENRCHRGYIKDKIREGVPPNPPENAPVTKRNIKTTPSGTEPVQKTQL